MKSIPSALRTKLLNQIKSQSTDSQPNIRIVATQTSYNTLLSEPIHEDVTADYGDVAIRQTAGESEPSLAYSICIDDDDEVVIRKRDFPALYDNPWEYVWTFPNEASEVAIEFDGTWKLNATSQWYYLETEQYPYIFTVENGALYVQKWNDATSRLQLVASGVAQISACKGWHNSIDTDDDQGLIIGYRKTDGGIYYRALCEQQDGTVLWESEHQVPSLGNSNDATLQVFRTNDFRVGFLTSQSGTIKFALTDRTYAGMSVRPETVTAYADASMSLDDIRTRRGYTDETMSAQAKRTYLLLDDASTDTSIVVSNSARLNREETWYSYGLTITLSKELFYDSLADLTSKIAVTKTIGGATTTVAPESITYDGTSSTITILFAADIIRTAQLNVTISETPDVWYERLQNMQWFLPALAVTFESQVRNYYGYENENMSASATSSMTYCDVAFTDGAENETMTAECSAAMVLEAASIEPI